MNSDRSFQKLLSLDCIDGICLKRLIHSSLIKTNPSNSYPLILKIRVSCEMGIQSIFAIAQSSKLKPVKYVTKYNSLCVSLNMLNSNKTYQSMHNVNNKHTSLKTEVNLCIRLLPFVYLGIGNL